MFNNKFLTISKGKGGKAIPVQAWTGREVFQEVQAARFHDSRHM